MEDVFCVWKGEEGLGKVSTFPGTVKTTGNRANIRVTSSSAKVEVQCVLLHHSLLPQCWKFLEFRWRIDVMAMIKPGLFNPFSLSGPERWA